MPINPALGQRITRALGQAGPSGSVPVSTWQVERDRLADLIEPAGDTDLAPAEVRALIDLLAESVAGDPEREPNGGWRRHSDQLVSELLAATSSSAK